MWLILVLLLLAPMAELHAQTNWSLGQAIETTLRLHPLLRIQQQQVEFSRGSVLGAQAQFDRTIQTGVSSGRTYRPLTGVERTVFNANSDAANSTTADFSATQLLRNGVTLNPVITLNRSTDNLASQLGRNESHISFQVNIPLLRGRGRDVVTARETASGLELEASLLDLNQTISDLIYNTAASYWSAVAAVGARQVYAEAEARGKVLLETVETLVAADRNPRSELSEVRANLADRTASRIAADQQLFEARQQLAVAIGLGAENAEELLRALEPSDPLPVNAGDPPDPDLAKTVTQALSNRADYLAAKKRQGGAALLADAAKNQLKPRLDVQLATGYSGLHEGTRPDQYLAAPFTGVHGVDATAGIRYEFPLENRAAEAGVVQSRASALQAGYRIQEVGRNISSSVVVALEAVRNAVRQLASVNESVAQFRTALDDQREKYRLGVGSLVEVLTVEDRLTGVLTAQVRAELGYALAIAKLRQATGTIVAPDKAVQRVDPGIFLHIQVVQAQVVQP